MDKHYKMYILVRDDVDLGHAMLAVGHGVAAAMLTFKDSEDLDKWQKESFRKVVCKVTPEQFEIAKALPDLPKVVMTESALENAETAMVYLPRKEWPKFFRSLPLYS